MPGSRDRLLGSGTYRQRVTVQALGTPAPDGDGGALVTWHDADPPTWAVSLTAAARSDGEHPMLGTTISTLTHVARGRYRPDVTTHSRLLLAGRVFNVLTVRNLDERDRTLELVCTEVLA